MKFKALFSESGLNKLEKGILPTFEKFGKALQLLLGPTDIFFVQAPEQADGAQVVARFEVGMLFESSRYTIQSRHHNLIGFAIDVALFVRVLRSAASHDAAHSLEVKLTTKDVPAGAGSTETVNKPFLCFMAKGANVNMVQDLPITKPYSGQDMTSLVTATQHPTLCPFYVDIAPAGPRVQAFIDRLKSIGDSIHFSTCKNGDLQLQALTTSARVGTQLQDLLVLPPQEPAAECDRSLPPDQQLEAATAAGDAATAVLPQKQLARVLHAAPLTSPLQVLMGVAGHGGYVHVMFVYAADGGGGGGSGGGYDAASSFSFKLPTKEEG